MKKSTTVTMYFNFISQFALSENNACRDYHKNDIEEMIISEIDLNSEIIRNFIYFQCLKNFHMITLDSLKVESYEIIVNDDDFDLTKVKFQFSYDDDRNIDEFKLIIKENFDF